MAESADKIKSLDELAELLIQVKARGLRIAHSHGVFDLLHPGYIRHLAAAHRTADLLVVTVIADEYVDKTFKRLAFNQRLRAESLAALQTVDYVAIVESPNAAEAIRKLRPDVYVRGREEAAKGDDPLAHAAEEDAVRAVGGQMYFSEEGSLDSTALLNDYFPVFSTQADAYLRHFRQHYSADQVIAAIKALHPLRVLVMGDIIIDEYCYCKAVGKSSKSATLTARFLSTERFGGGVLAVANHVAGYADEVHLLTYIGYPEKDETFIRQHLKANIGVHLIRQMGRPTVVKRRYVDPFQLSKMFEVMWLDDEEPLPDAEDGLLAQLAEITQHCDLVIVADFGHGNVGSRTIQWLATQPAFLAVNAQTNSANIGYNLITKYPRADYICIDESEMRLANHSLHGDLRVLTEQTAQRMRCQVATVTQGSSGASIWAGHGQFIHMPVFSTDVTDSVGAGDAYLSIASLCARARYTPELTSFIGNCAGALAVRIVGNRESVEPEPLFKFINTLLR